jgi:hypothetical protein
MKVDLDELEASVEGLKNLLVEHSKRSPGFLTVTDTTNGEQLECIQPLLIRRSTVEDRAFTEAVAAACTNIFALITELRELRAERDAAWAEAAAEENDRWADEWWELSRPSSLTASDFTARAAALRAGEVGND